MRRCAIPEQDRDADHEPDERFEPKPLFDEIAERFIPIAVCRKCGCVYIYLETPPLPEGSSL